jgi:predicted transcriptional regulator
MADVYCRGSTAGLIAELIRTERLSPDEIQQLQELAKAKTSAKTSFKKKGGKKS